jgi:hypothetical protein
MDEITEQVLREAHAFARPKVAAAGKRGTLVSSMEAILNAKYASRGGQRYAEGSLNIPYYWAIFVHQGRPNAPYTKQRGVYVFWRDPSEDPRRPGGREPRRRSDLRRLTIEEFNRAVMRRREWIADGGDPRDSPVVITRVIRSPTKAIPFFSNTDGRGMLGFQEIGAKKIESGFDGFVKQQLGSVNRLRVKDTATARL